MKNVIISAIVLATVLTSCNHKSSDSKADIGTSAADSTQMYACSMDPEITGKKDEKCSKCGMDLTEPVAKK
jgi:hypothetical protein